jgi:hypothetical protein
VACCNQWVFMRAQGLTQRHKHKARGGGGDSRPNEREQATHQVVMVMAQQSSLLSSCVLIVHMTTSMGSSTCFLSSVKWPCHPLHGGQTNVVHWLVPSFTCTLSLLPCCSPSSVAHLLLHVGRAICACLPQTPPEPSCACCHITSFTYCRL